MGSRQPIARGGRLAQPCTQWQGSTLEGAPFDFSKLENRVVLVTNVACECGYTKSNYEQLVAMDEKYKGELAILAFPSNQFRGQEPGTPSEIREFVRKRNVTFDMMEKSDVNGPNTNPIYKALKAATDSADQDIAWNFETKFLIARDGVSVTRLSKAFNNDKIRDNIEALIVAGRGSDAKM